MDSPYIRQSIDSTVHVSKIVIIHYLELARHFAAVGETHDFWELVYMDTGEAEVTAKNKTFALKPGEAVFHKPNEFHALRVTGDTPPNAFVINFVCKSKAMDHFKGKHLTVPAPLRKYITGIIAEGGNAFYLGKNNPYLTRLVPKEDAPIGSKQLIKLYLETFLILLMRLDEDTLALHPEQLPTQDGLTAKVKEILGNHIYGKISVEEICNRLNFSRTHLSAHFKRHCGCTITEYLTNLKIEQAKQLIRQEQYNISQISDLLCYDNPHYFSRVFKSRTGLTPSQYKRSVSV